MDLVAKLTELRGLTLEDTRVSDAGMGRVSRLCQLRFLSLDGTLVTDEGLAALSSSKSLELLNLDDTKVTDRGLRLLKGASNLRHLGIFHRPVGGETLASLAFLARVTQLREVQLGDASVSGADLERFQLQAPTVQLKWWRCGIVPDPFIRELALRQVRRQGWTGRLRLAWRSMAESF